jgi:hypothetical protein
MAAGLPGYAVWEREEQLDELGQIISFPVFV